MDNGTNENRVFCGPEKAPMNWRLRRGDGSVKKRLLAKDFRRTQGKHERRQARGYEGCGGRKDQEWPEGGGYEARRKARS